MSLLNALWRPAPPAAVPRQALTLLHLQLPALARSRLVDAVRLQLVPYMERDFAFVCRREGDELAVWAWPIDAAATAAMHRTAWPEPLLEAPAAGLRLLARRPGFEAQAWDGGRLRHSRWFAEAPDGSVWVQFVRGSGHDPAEHPLPRAVSAVRATTAPDGWQRGDSLPRPDPWRGWRWQAAALALGALASTAAAWHLQVRAQLEDETERLAQLRSEHAASTEARARYEQAQTKLDAIDALAPQVSQLALLGRVVDTGIFATGGNAPAPTLAEWDYRGRQLKLTLDVPEGDVSLVEITRRLEAMPGFGALRIGQESAANSVTLSTTVGSTADAGAASAVAAATPAR